MQAPKFFLDVAESKQRAILDDAARLWQIAGKPLCPLTAAVRFHVKPSYCMQIISYFMLSVRVKEDYKEISYLVKDLRTASLQGFIKRVFKQTDYWLVLPLVSDGYETLLYFLQVFHGMRYMATQMYPEAPFSIAKNVIYIVGKSNYLKLVERIEEGKISSFYVDNIAGFSHAALGYYYET